MQSKSFYIETMTLNPAGELRRILMKRKILFAVAIAVFAFSFGVHPVLADDPPPACPVPPCVYVDPQRNPAGNEDGTLANPYNTYNEGQGYALAQTNGAYVIVKNPDGTWTQPDHIDGATLGRGGITLPKFTIYLLVAVLALSLMVAGRILQRRSQLRIR
jgi:hypothetical protein